MPTRHHTPPPIPTAEHNLIRLEIHENKFVEVQGALAQIRRQLNTVEKTLIELCGRDGQGGALGWLKEEQQRSASSQGERIGKLEAHARDIDSGLRRIEVRQVDTRARMFAVVATLLALASLAVKLLGH